MQNLFFILLLVTSLTACGSLKQQSAADEGEAEEAGDIIPDPDIDVSEEEVIQEILFLFGTDYTSSGQLYVADADPITELLNSGIASLGSSAIIRFFDGLLYVLHDGYSFFSSDNVQIIDTAGSFTTQNTWSTGSGTNPHDLVVVGDTAYITLYDPSSDPGNLAANGHPGDLIVMDLTTGTITKRMSFFDYLNVDADMMARADQMVRVGDKLYVCIQDFGSDFTPNSPGKLAVIDLATNEIEIVYTLTGWNPVDIVYSETANKLFIAQSAGYGAYDFAATTHGGIEIVPANDPAMTTLLTDDVADGYIERLVVSEGRLFAVASELQFAPVFLFLSDVWVMDENNETEDGLAVFASDNADIRDMVADGNGYLWIARRTIEVGSGDATDPHVDVVNSTTGESIASNLTSDVPITSMAIGQF